MDSTPAQIANGARMPNKRLSKPSTRALVAELSLVTSPEGPAPEEQIEDRADAPEEGDDDPQELGEAAHVLAVDDVDHAQDEGDGVEEDREQDLGDELQHRTTPLTC